MKYDAIYSKTLQAQIPYKIHTSLYQSPESRFLVVKYRRVGLYVFSCSVAIAWMNIFTLWLSEVHSWKITPLSQSANLPQASFH